MFIGEFNLLFPMRLYLIIIHLGFQCKYRNWIWNYTFILIFFSTSVISIITETVIFNKVKAKSWFLDNFIQIKQSIGHPFVHAALCLIHYSTLLSIPYILNVLFFYILFLSIIQTLKCFLYTYNYSYKCW